MRATTERQRAEIYEDALTYLQEHYASQCSIDDAAGAIATSRRQLQRVMEGVGGGTFRRTLATVRMQKAAELLTSRPDVTVRQVALAVGYAQPAQFAKSFARIYGVPPSRYRTLTPDARPPTTAAAPQRAAQPTPGHDWSPPPFGVAIERHGEATVVRLSGELDLATIGYARQALDALRDQGVRSLTIDLSALEFIDSTGLQMLLELNAEASVDGFRMHVRRGTPAVQHILAIAGVANRLPFID
jgi:anti-anti-sigma factor